MKKVYFTLLISAAAAMLSSCIVDGSRPGGETGTQTREVEISIATSPSAGATRTPGDNLSTELGGGRENTIETLDLLVFEAGGKYLYRSEATLVSATSQTQSVYKAKLRETTDPLDVHFLANCREWLSPLDDIDPEQTQYDWSDIHALLYDDEPAKIVDEGKYLPMYDKLPNQFISTTTAPTRWDETVDLTRSVASFDVFVDKDSNDTQRFELQDLFVYRAALRGYLGELIENVDEENGHAANITTGLDSREDDEITTDNDEETMRAGGAGPMKGAENKNYDAIAYKMYVYENPYTQTGNDTKRPTRVIVAGEYTAEGEEGPTRYYYPIDILDEVNGQVRYIPVERNHKYEFIITAVSGPGYGTLEEAKTGALRNLNVRVVPWNKKDVQIGVKGKYYMTMEEKEVRLWRNEGDSRQAELTYEVIDDDSAQFILDFNGKTVGDTPVNGAQTEIANGIRNEYFTVTMSQTQQTADEPGKVLFTVTARKDYDAAHCEDKVRVQFRDLYFDIDIFQLDSSDEDWDDGGTIPVGTPVYNDNN